MEKYKNTYRIASARMPTWDYGQESSYFITICTRMRLHYFGEIINDQMEYNEIGRSAIDEWFKTPLIRPDMNITLGEFTLMPNHLHGIIDIGKNECNSGRVQDTSTNSFGPQQKNLGSIIRSFKSSVTIYACKNNNPFSWQERYHDHIIRDDEDYSRIRSYINDNIVNWKKDKFYSL